MTEVSRRRVIGVGAAAVAAGTTGIGMQAGAAHAAEPTYTSAEALYRRPRFSALKGKGFSITRSGTGTPVKLVEVADLASAPAGAPDRFRLTFTVTGALPKQGTYTVRRPGFTPTSVFLVPEGTRKAMTAIVDTSR